MSMRTRNLHLKTSMLCSTIFKDVCQTTIKPSTIIPFSRIKIIPLTGSKHRLGCYYCLESLLFFIEDARTFIEFLLLTLYHFLVM